MHLGCSLYNLIFEVDIFFEKINHKLAVNRAFNVAAYCKIDTEKNETTKDLVACE